MDTYLHMSSTSEEIQQLKLRLIELEKLEKEKNENDNNTSIEHNFNVINDVLVEKKKRIISNSYSKSIPLARYYDQQLVIHLDAIYNILQIVDKRLNKIEECANK